MRNGHPRLLVHLTRFRRLARTVIGQTNTHQSHRRYAMLIPCQATSSRTHSFTLNARFLRRAGRWGLDCFRATTELPSNVTIVRMDGDAACGELDSCRSIPRGSFNPKKGPLATYRLATVLWPCILCCCDPIVHQFKVTFKSCSTYSGSSAMAPSSMLVKPHIATPLLLLSNCWRLKSQLNTLSGMAKDMSSSLKSPVSGRFSGGIHFSGKRVNQDPGGRATVSIDR